MKRNLWVVLISLALLAAGCSRVGSRTDAQVASEVQNKINGDGRFPDKGLNVASSNGTVTLSGNVSSDAARNAAAEDASQVEGVKTVVNNLQVTPASASGQMAQPQQQAADNPPPMREERRPSPSTRARSTSPRASSPRATASGSDSDDTTVRNVAPPPASSSNSGSSNSDLAESGASSAPAAPAAPAEPQKITIPAGTQISIRLNDEVNSEKAQVGDVFHGSVSAPITVDDQMVIPTTADVEGRVVEVKSAGRFAGQSILTLELSKLTMSGKSYSLQTSQWSRSGNGRGKSTAAKVGGGAAVGAILGGVFGGGKGAAIGAAAGAGAGTGVSAATKGQQIILKPEAIVAFQLQSPITVTPGAGRSAMNQ